MTKAEIVAKISNDLGIEKGDVLATVESFMSEVKGLVRDWRKCLFKRIWKFHYQN